MADPAPEDRCPDTRYTVERYFQLAREGVLAAGDRVELLEGVIVAVSPHNPRHAAGVRLATRAVMRAVGDRAVVQVQLSLVAGSYSVPEPDVAVLPGQQADYFDEHPTTALLAVEVADSSLTQDRITESAIYAAAGVPEYWIVNLVDEVVEVFRAPQAAARRYASRMEARPGDQLEILALPGCRIDVRDLIPVRRDS